MKKVLLSVVLFTSLLVSGSAQCAQAESSWNGGFEAGLDGWETPILNPRKGQKPAKMEVNIVEAPDYQVREGKKALQIDTVAWSPDIRVKSAITPLPQNDAFQQLSFWQYYEGKRGYKFGARIQLYDADKAAIKDAHYTATGDAHTDKEWSNRRTNFQVPQNAKYFTVELYWEFGRGKITFDEILLSPIAPRVGVKTGYNLSDLSNEKHALWVASAMEKIYPDATPPQSDGKEIQIHAAQGESHSVQLVYQPTIAQADLMVSADDLKSQDGTKVLLSEILDIRYVGDVKIGENFNRFGRGGATPDPLLPDAPAELEAEKPQSIWITAVIPRDAEAGIYSSTLHLKTAQETVEIPLQLEVFNFAIPEKVQLQTHSHSAVPPGSTGAKMRVNLRRHLLENRMTSEIGYGKDGTQTLNLKLNDDNTVTVDWLPWDAAMEKYFSAGMEQFLVPRTLFGGMGGMSNDGIWTAVGKDNKITYGTPEWRTAIASYVQQMYAHLQEKGWLEHAIWELWDEPRGAESRAQLRDIAALIRENAPKAKIMVTNWPAPPYDSNIDIWSPTQNDFLPEFRQEVKAEFWTYNNGLYTIDIPYGLTAMRDLAWWAWDNDIKSVLWWNIADGWARGAKLYSNVVGQLKQNGNGFLFYPGKDGDLTKVVDSMRVAAYRSGLNDYDYFTLLANAQDAAVTKSQLSEKAPTGKQLVKVLLSAGLDKFDPNLQDQIRLIAAQLIAYTQEHPEEALQLEADFLTTKTAQAISANSSKKVLLR